MAFNGWFNEYSSMVCRMAWQQEHVVYLRCQTAVIHAAMRDGMCGHCKVEAGFAANKTEMLVEQRWEDEVCDEDVQEDVCQFVSIDICGELVKRACAAFAAVARVVQMSELVRFELTSLHRTFKYISDYVRHSPDDNLELFAARAMKEVEELLRQQAMPAASLISPQALEELKIIQRLSQDIVVLACSRFIDQRLMQTSRIPPALGYRFLRAFAPLGMDFDQRYSRLGNAKYQIFNSDRDYTRSKNRHGRVRAKNLPLDLGEPCSINVSVDSALHSCPWELLPEPVHICSQTMSLHKLS